MTGPSGTVEYEPADAEPRLIAGLAAGAAAFLILTPLVLQLLYPQALHRRVVVGDAAAVPAPRLQIDPPADLSATRQAEAKRLSAYGWVDRDRNIVHVPIDRALELTLERGLPGWPKP
jgi:hypothetical protein